MNPASDLPLHIDPSSPIPINVQLKEQLLCLVASGLVKPGEFLPPAGELAERLSLNRNTVNAIYNQLARDGAVAMKKGSGTQVLHSPRIAEDREMYAYIQRLIRQAADKRFHLPALAVDFLVISQIRDAVSELSNRILFVAFRPNEYEQHADEISSVKISAVTVKPFDELIGLEAEQWAAMLEEIDMVVTPYAGLREIGRLNIPESKRIVAVGDIPY